MCDRYLDIYMCLSNFRLSFCFLLRIYVLGLIAYNLGDEIIVVPYAPYMFFFVRYSLKNKELYELPWVTYGVPPSLIFVAGTYYKQAPIYKIYNIYIHIYI